MTEYIKVLCAAIEQQAQQVYEKANHEEKVFIDTQLLLCVKSVQAALVDKLLSTASQQQSLQRLLTVYDCWRYKL